MYNLSYIMLQLFIGLYFYRKCNSLKGNSKKATNLVRYQTEFKQVTALQIKSRKKKKNETAQVQSSFYQCDTTPVK